jgi:NHL repeat/WD40-like Beta Propeller Repeat
MRSLQWRGRRVATAVSCVVALGLVVGVGSAGAVVTQFGGEGEGAGQFSGASGIGLDQESGDVYVADSGNNRVEKFGSEGAFLLGWGEGVADGTTTAFQACEASCFQGLQGEGSGEFSGPSAVAVDNSLGLSHGDVYVVDVVNNRVEKFSASGEFLLMFGGEVNRTKDETAGATDEEKDVCTAVSGNVCKAGGRGAGPSQFEGLRENDVAVDATGTVYVGDLNRVQRFSSGGVFVGEVPLPGANRVMALAVDSSEDVYVETETSPVNGIRKFDSSGVELGEPRDQALRPGALGVDITTGASGELFVLYGEQHHVLEYDSAGNEVASFPTDIGSPGGIVFGEGLKVLYVLDKAHEVVRLERLPSPGPMVLAGSESATGLLPSSGSLNATINPESRQTTYRFEYGTSTAYGLSIPVPDGEIPASFEDTPVSVELSGLSIDTTYHYRVVATNSNGTAVGPDETFTTLPPALIDSESSTNVTSGSSTLEGEINPLGADTIYRFEYGTSTSYGRSVPSPEGDIGSGSGDVPVSSHVQGLQPATTYHYRLVATNVLGVTVGGDRLFTTQPATGGRGSLPDGRAWEMVSPVDKQGAALEPVSQGGGAIQASAGGDGITYLATGATEVDPGGNRNFELTQLFSVRGARGWSTRDIDTPNETVGSVTVGGGFEYRLFSSDLSAGLVEPRTDTPLPPLSKGAERTVYLRDDLTGEYMALVTADNVPSGIKFGSNQAAGYVEVVDATPDLSHVVLTSPAALTSDAVEDGSHRSIYEWGGGKLALVSVLPNHEPADPKAFADLGWGDGMVRRAISDDGSRIVWSESSGAKHIYLRDMVREETVQIDAASGVKEPEVDQAEFQTASTDGSKIFFTSESRLTPDSTASAAKHEADLYAFELTSTRAEPPAGRLIDLTVDGHASERANVRGVIGASDDGTSIYFAATGLLGDTTEPVVAGGADLYVERYDQSTKAWSAPRRVASLPATDSPTWGNDRGSRLQAMASRVSPDGRLLAFMSSRPLTGYDNRDANSGVADEEVFLYDSATDRVSCVSCDPTGARPVGALDVSEETLPDSGEAWTEHWLAGLIPDWAAADIKHSIHQSRYLSDSGRLFFGTPQALVPGDTNGTWDVYEYEPVGVGGCLQGSPMLQVALDACVGLISSGGSGEESAFLEASETGDDVFFLTKAGLSPLDGDGLFDVYDARVCTESRPCFPVPPVTSPACSTSDSCKAAPTPQPEGLGAPASQTFSGAGNVLVPVPATVRAKSLTRAQKLARALKACQKKPKRRRPLCRRQARKRYGSAAQAKRSKANKGLPARAGR